jgi:probable addiction module antidote protein
VYASGADFFVIFILFLTATRQRNKMPGLRKGGHRDILSNSISPRCPYSETCLRFHLPSSISPLAIEENDRAIFLLALRNVAKAHGGMAAIAEKANMNRESLYRMLSKKGNPEIQSLYLLLHAMGLRLAVETGESQAA